MCEHIWVKRKSVRKRNHLLALLIEAKLKKSRKLTIYNLFTMFSSEDALQNKESRNIFPLDQV